MSAAASSTCATASARSAASAGEVSVATSSTSRSSPVPLDRAVHAHAAAAQAPRPVGEVALCQARGRRECGAEDDRQLDRSRLRESADEHRERSPAEREDVVGVQRAAEELEVVGEHERDADEHERHQVDADRAHAPEADRRCAGERDGRGDDERASGEAGGERPAVELVQAMRRDADGERERDQRPGQARAVDVRREAGAERHVREVPRRVREVQERDAVAQAAGPERVERDALGVTGQRALPRRPVRRRD